MSSHREAPEISKDPVADSTDVYAFVSSGQAGHGHAHRQLHSGSRPGRRLNFYSFGDEVLYEIHVDNNDDARPDVTFQFRFRTELRDLGTFPEHRADPARSAANWNSRQFYSVTRISQGYSVVLGAVFASSPATSARSPPPRQLRRACRTPAVHGLPGGIKVLLAGLAGRRLRRPRRDPRPRRPAPLRDTCTRSTWPNDALQAQPPRPGCSTPIPPSLNVRTDRHPGAGLGSRCAVQLSEGLAESTCDRVIGVVDAGEPPARVRAWDAADGAAASPAARLRQVSRLGNPLPSTRS